MRTQGTFCDVYRAAKCLFTDATGCPIDPVVRCDGDDWMIESALEPAHDSTFEISLEQFHSYWHESYADDAYAPSAADEEEFEELY